MAAEVGAIAMSMRDRPTRLDWLAVGARGLGLSVRIRNEHRRARAGNPWQYFDDELPSGRWKEIPEEFRELVLEHVGDRRVEEAYWDGDEGDRVCLGALGDEELGWIEETDGTVVDGPYLVADREDETLRALGERIWRRLGTSSCEYTAAGLVADRSADTQLVPTEQLATLRRRIEAFLRHGVSRSFLLVGPPGTGKSMGIRYLARGLGLTSLRVDLGVFGKLHGFNSDSSVSASLTTLLKLLRPQAMILDDIDRLSVGGELLHFLELAVRSCDLVLASANCTGKMMGAALRPGRFDEMVTVDTLDPRLLRTMLGRDADLFERMKSLPVAYVAEFVKRRKVLGRVVAESELAELEKRAAMIGERTADGA